MINATRKTFKEIYSIELDEAIHKQAQKRFSKFSNISIIQGDSRDRLPEILRNIDEPCLFWLDSHYSGGITAKKGEQEPVVEELNCLVNHPLFTQHIILIDDGCYFENKDQHPTINDLKKIILERYSNHTFKLEDGIIRIHKQQTPL